MRPAAPLLSMLTLGLALSLSAVPAASVLAQRSVEGDETAPSKPIALENQIYDAFVRGEYEQAVALIKQHLKGSPNDYDMLYNLACAYSLLKQYDNAATSLLAAFKAGFSDFEQARKAERFSSSLPFTAAGSSTPQCALTG